MEGIGARVTCPLGHPGPLATSSKESRSRLVGCLTLGVGGQSLPLPTPSWRTCEIDPPVLICRCAAWFAYAFPDLHAYLLVCMPTTRFGDPQL